MPPNSALHPTTIPLRGLLRYVIVICNSDGMLASVDRHTDVPFGPFPVGLLAALPREKDNP